jgi:hypothetical protein
MNKLLLLIFAVGFSPTIFAQNRSLEKIIGEEHSSDVSGAQEAFFAISQLPNGTIVAAGYKIPACKPKTEKVEGSYWEKVVKPCPDEIKRMYLVYLDTAANILGEKIWGDTAIDTKIVFVKPLKGGQYAAVSEKGKDDVEEMVLSVLDSSNAVVIEKTIKIAQKNHVVNVDKVAVNAQNQIVVTVVAVWSGNNRKYMQMTFDAQLNKLSSKPIQIVKAKIDPLVDFRSRGVVSIRENKIADVKFPDKSSAELYGLGNSLEPTADLRIKNAQGKTKSVKYPEVLGKAMAADKYGNLWIVGMKTRDNFDENAWIVRYRRK